MYNQTKVTCILVFMFPLSLPPYFAFSPSRLRGFA